MDNKRFDYITSQYLKGVATSEEETELLSAVKASATLRAAFRERTAAFCPAPDPEADRKWGRIASVIAPQAKPAKPAARTLWYVAAAAILLVCLSGLTTLFLIEGDSLGDETPAMWQTVVAEQADRSCTLPDGTSVFLRKGGSLSYPRTFGTSRREVKISGEAFFDVTPDARKPFVVDASALFVQVLGTSFSVCTAEEAATIAVTLLEGSVSLNDRNQHELVRLTPNQQAEYTPNNGHCTVTAVDSERLTSWRKGILIYDNASLSEIVALIEQTYAVTLQYQKPADDSQRFSGAFLRTQTLEVVLESTRKLTGTSLTATN